MPRLFGLAVTFFLPCLIHASSPFPGGVLDSTGRTAYLGANGAIVAIDLASGEPRWRSTEGSEPLFVITGRLYTLSSTSAGRLYIRALNLGERGQRAFESDPIELPRWAVPENGPGRSFSYRWKRELSRLDMSWQVAAWAEGSPRKHSSGSASIDLKTGKVTQREAMPGTERVPAVLERHSVRWHSTESGRVRAVVQEEQSGSSAFQRRHVLVLRNWDAQGRESSSRELFRGQEPIVLADSTGTRLWFRDTSPPPERDSKFASYWLVCSTEGREVARVPFVPGTTAATIHGTRAYFLVPSGIRLGVNQPARRGRSLVAVDLESGKIVWRCTL